MNENVYRSLAAALADVIGESGYFNGTVGCGAGGMDGVLRCTLIRGEKGTEEKGVLAGWVPVWWEFLTRDGDGCLVDNNFSWRELCKYGG